ncbi:stalk domain-containing protein [Anoxynatronum buryatiense]|uniref:Fibronectin type III domain-containing protein n=1 Tax=Anoxynatronum buryatiense TaxID=489973 RepID=A0AA45WY61_9CLOT|nr:stalk domain-containing protein [Anoxynatronum buryatiense]SMP62481.1 Fibronectin type III domain-containing protein [Anoxynatronum buryatiense]
MKKRIIVAVTVLMMVLVLVSGSVTANDLQLAPQPFVNLTSPTGGESFQVGSNQSITWQKSSAGGTTQIYFSANGGTNWTYVTSVMGTSYNWTVPDQVTNQGRIRVRWSPNNEAWYTNNSGNFTVFKALGPQDLNLIAVPPAPTDLAASAVSASSINLTWQDNATNETGYKVERRVTNQAGGFNEIAVLDANTTQFADTGLSAMTNYTYRVRAYNGMGNSAFSNEAAATTQALGLAPPPANAPAAPTDLIAEAADSPAFALSWTDNAGNEQAFHIERQVNGGNFDEIAEVGANVTVYVDENVMFDTLYLYRVRARNANGFSAYSNEMGGIIEQVADPEAEEPEEPGEMEEPEVPGEPEPQPETPGLPPSTPSAPSGEGIVIRFFINQSDYFVNDSLETMDTSPIISGGRTLLPIRYVAEALGATVGWDAGDQRVTIQFNETTIELWINRNSARVNGVMQQIDANNAQVTPVIIPPGRTMLPLRFVAENLGSSVDWEPVGQEVIIVYPAP